MKTLKMVHGMGGSQLPEIQKQLQHLVVWWPNTTE
jgi:hypothetical protein